MGVIHAKAVVVLATGGLNRVTSSNNLHDCKSHIKPDLACSVQGTTRRFEYQVPAQSFSLPIAPNIRVNNHGDARTRHTSTPE